MRRLYLVREGKPVAAVVEFGPFFGSGQAVIQWFGNTPSIAIYPSLDMLKRVHVHEGTELRSIGDAACSRCQHWRWEDDHRQFGQCGLVTASTYHDDECPSFKEEMNL
jgi:hypothetical protein